MIRITCLPLCLSLTSEEELKGNYYNEEICGFCTTRSETALKLVINKKFLKMYGIFLLGSLFMCGVRLQNRRDFNRHFLGESYSCHLWLFQQWKAVERRKYLPRGWAIIKKKEGRGWDNRNFLLYFHSTSTNQKSFAELVTIPCLSKKPLPQASVWDVLFKKQRSV